jgi:predicted ATPase/DNA-binding winged helix-turn-helix (wHTH) protein
VPSDPADQPLRFARVEISPAERLVRVDGEPAPLGARAFDVLLALVRRRERVVSKQELLDAVWAGVMVEEHNITVQISTLRKLLGADTIATIAGRGYQFTATVETSPVASVTPAVSGQPHHNLPDQRTRFIGREDALADLGRLLPSTRLLTLSGIGGCGKTRLALRLAQDQLAAFPDGVWFVDLSALTDADRVASTCAGVFGIREAGDTPVTELLVRHLADRRVLLVLDNCEHVLARAVALVDALLAGAPGTTVVATSREALGVRGEQIYAVRSLSLPATSALDAVLGAESARVFVDRARLALPDFTIDAQSAPAVAEICRRLDGVALAIELAAARVTMLSVAEIAARLDDRFRLLTGGDRALPRHQTLGAAMQWSYDMLPPDAQRMLRHVAVFAGGWTLDGAATVAAATDEYDALALLTVLHDKSLLVVDRDAAGGRPRYRLLETVRQYALERLGERGEDEVARRRHLAHYLALAEAAEPRLRGPEQDAWLTRLRQEHENLVVALAWCREGSGDPQAGMRLVAATTYYWIWNNFELGTRLTVAALERDHTAADTLARGAALNALARMNLSRGRFEEGLAYARDATAIARRLGEPRLLARALYNQDAALTTLCRSEEAHGLRAEALELARGLGDLALVANLLNGIAEAERTEGRLADAERSYREALDLSRGRGGRMEVVIVIDNLIRVQVARGDYDDAWRLAKEALPLARHDKIAVDLLEVAAGLAAALGEHARAARMWGTADATKLGWGYQHQPVDIAHLEPLLAASRAAIGDAAYAAAEAEGRARDLETAMVELEGWLGERALPQRAGAGSRRSQ